MNFSLLCDRLNDALDDAEEAIADLHLGVSAEVPLGDKLLRFGKDGNEWCLSVVFDGHSCHLLKAPLLVRSAAAEQLGALLDALQAKQGEVASQIEQATLRANNFTHAVRAMSADAAANTCNPGGVK